MGTWRSEPHESNIRWYPTNEAAVKELLQEHGPDAKYKESPLVGAAGRKIPGYPNYDFPYAGSEVVHTGPPAASKGRHKEMTLPRRGPGRPRKQATPIA